jgi:rhamnulokinase
MSTSLTIAAVDMGAESGRVSVGRFDGTRMEIDVVHRFANRPVRLGDTLYWNLPGWMDEIGQGLRKAADAAGGPIAAVGVDTWGVDFGLLDANGQLLGMPVHYRDARTEGAIEEVTARIPREDLFAQTGIAFWPFNTLFQLRAMALQGSPALRDAASLLFVPDLLHYYLSGAKVAERSIASTSQCMDVQADRWLGDLLGSLDIPASIFPEIVPSGTVLGEVSPRVAEDTGLRGTKVVVPAGHDTGSAVAAAPLSSSDAAYLSCGTWSLLGLERPRPMATPEALAAGFTNERGAGTSYRILQNIMGLWLVQQSRAAWAKAGTTYDYADLAAMAAAAPAFRSWVNPNDLRFYAPADMVAEVRAACAESGQPVPDDVPAVMRTLLESLAFAYRAAVDNLERLQGIRIPALHIIGGGAQNVTLCQWAANALARPVTAGPVEGTTMGNMAIQLMGLGELPDQAAIRAVVRASTDIITYEPRDTEAWAEAYGRYRQVVG